MKTCFLLFPFIVSMTLVLKGQDCDSIAADKYLSALFLNGDYISYDSTKFKGFDNTLQLIKTPLLNKFLPGYCFYSTTFMSHYYEYLFVETALAFHKNAGKQSLLIHSPVFTTESKDFINLFSNLQITDTTPKEELAKEIMTISSSITHGGHFNRLINLNEKEAISYELWHDNLSWEIYDFYFDSNNKLTWIKVKGGVKRNKMWDGYKRL